MKNLFFGFGLSSVLLLIRLLALFFSKKSITNFLKELDINIFWEWLFGSIALSVFFSVSIYINNLNYLLLILVGILFGSFFMSFGFFIFPYIIMMQKEKFTTANMYQDWAIVNIDTKLKVKILSYDVINAYATGIFSNSKIILLSEKLINELPEKDIKNLLFHEYAHLKYNHLLILYFSNVFCCSLSVISASHFYPMFETTSTPGLLVALHGSLFGGLYILVPGLVQRRLEYVADSYASSMVGVDSYVGTLITLNRITNKGLEKRVINYPNLQERINNVSK